MKKSRNKARQARPSPPPIMAAEREQIRIRRSQDFPLVTDEHGRERVPSQTADGRRSYTKSVTGIVRLRLADPLVEMQGLSPRQRNAGLEFRTHYEIASTSGIKPVSMAERVDSGGLPRGAPAHILDAFAAMARAKQALGHHEIVTVVEYVCGQRMSIREVAERMHEPRPALSKLLSIGLDNLATHYFGKVKRAG